MLIEKNGLFHIIGNLKLAHYLIVIIIFQSSFGLKEFASWQFL
jgi:hypothetical protein